MAPGRWRGVKRELDMDVDGRSSVWPIANSCWRKSRMEQDRRRTSSGGREARLAISRLDSVSRSVVVIRERSKEGIRWVCEAVGKLGKRMRRSLIGRGE